MNSHIQIRINNSFLVRINIRTAKLMRYQLSCPAGHSFMVKLRVHSANPLLELFSPIHAVFPSVN